MSSRYDKLRDTPAINRSEIGMDWTDRWRLQVVDLFCGRGGVGYAISNIPAPIESRMHAGYDIEDFSDTYPGQFAQMDLLDEPSARALGNAIDFPSDQGYNSCLIDRGVINDEYGPPSFDGLTADVVWISFPCTAYSSLSPTYYGSQEAALEANPRITDEIREVALEISPHYVIENVPRATSIGDLEANCRVNGLAFGLPFDVERHFETTFPVPDAYHSGSAEVKIDTRGDQSVQDLAEAKGVPPSWGKQGVRSAIPWQYVYWILHYCPTFPAPAPKRIESMLPKMPNDLGVVNS